MPYGKGTYGKKNGKPKKNSKRAMKPKYKKKRGR